MSARTGCAIIDVGTPCAVTGPPVVAGACEPTRSIGAGRVRITIVGASRALVHIIAAAGAVKACAVTIAVTTSARSAVVALRVAAWVQDLTSGTGVSWITVALGVQKVEEKSVAFGVHPAIDTAASGCPVRNQHNKKRNDEPSQTEPACLQPRPRG